MNPNSSFWKKRIDNFLLLLIFFAFLLLSLFMYLEKIDRDIKNYGTYQHKLQRMVNYEKDMENCFLKTFRYVDYDRIDKILRAFEQDIRFFKHSKIGEEFGAESYDMVLNIEKLYLEKMELIEQFQSANARATNAVHYLYDLRKTIEKKFPDDVDKHNLMNQFFFLFGKVLMGLPLDTLLLNKDLNALKQNSGNQYFDYFYRQTKQFMSDVRLIKKLFVTNEKIDSLGAIKALTADLSQKYHRNLNQQRAITLIFFVLAFLILIILFYQYRRVKWATLELKAFRYAVENSDNAVVITDAQRHILYANEAFEQHSGYKASEVLGSNPNILKSDLHSNDFYKKLNETLDRGEKWQGELINRRKDGSLLYEKASIVPIIVDGELVQYLAIKLDITEYIEIQKKLQQSAAAFETIGEGVLTTDGERKIISANPAFIRMFGYTEEELIGKEPTVVSSDKDNTLFYGKLRKELSRSNHWSGRVQGQTKEGRLIPIWLTVTVVRDNDGNIQNSVVIYTNLEEIIEMKDKAEFLAYHDSLTRLPNRAYIEKEIIDIFGLTKETDIKVAILFVDLDRFKVINDTLGHYVGDKMLVELASRLKKILGKNDILARFGGDEFVIVMGAVSDNHVINILAEKILSAIREPITVQEYHLNMTASIGIAIYPNDGEEISIIIKHADAAMYHAKEQGKDNYQFYSTQLSIEMHRRLDLEQKLMYAVEKNEFSLAYQPQYELKSRKICGAEALLRWNSPDLGIVSPAQFIPVAEETGVIVTIGYFVLREAARAYLQWREEGAELEWVSINLSSIQFRQEDLLENFRRIIDETGIDAGNLELEITERCLMDYTEENLAILNGFRKMGCRISIDDFGTGYSSMGYLKDFSIDSIKIDKSFVDHLPTDANNAEVSTAIIALSHTLEYTVVAEGIETREQEEFLRGKGCDYGQGYYFSRPLKSEALIKFVKNRQSGYPVE